jgi:uncharacterized protein (TIGR03492 family)
VSAVLFVTNGHGEMAIAERIALELHGLLPQASIDHVALVGDQSAEGMNDVGPRRAMPSGGLIAMGNARNIALDLRAGLLPLTLAQARFLRRSRGEYHAVVAVGDVYAFAMALLARAPAVFVGTAKSVEVAPYGRIEERFLARAVACFVRDDATAAALQRDGVRAEAANAIVDLFARTADSSAEPAVAGFAPPIALFPGSRESAYEDAEFLLEVTRAIAAKRPQVGAVLSIARNLDALRFARDAAHAGWDAIAGERENVPFVLRDGEREIVRAWSGTLGPVLDRVTVVLGQAGTANEAAAAAGVPVLAFERDRDRKARWYRERQRGLLGGALVVVPSDRAQAADAVVALLDDPVRRSRMGEVGRARMGPPGAARRIAQRVAAMVEAS